MTIKRIRSILWLSALAICAGAAGMVGWHVKQPAGLADEYMDRVPMASDSSTAIRPSGTTPLAGPGREQLLALAARDYRQRLFDPPVVAPPPPAPKPVPQVELVSTILREAGSPTAWVRDGQNHRKVGVGDRVGPEDNPATVMQIMADQVVLDHDGREAIITLHTGGSRR